MPENQGRNRVSIQFKPWLAAAVLAVLVSPSAEGACSTGFVERIDRVTQESECIPQGVIRQQKLQSRQASRNQRIRKERALQQQERIRAQREIQRNQANRGQPGLSSKKRHLKQLRRNKQKRDRQKQLALRQQIGELISDFRQRQPTLTRRQASRGEEIIGQPELLENKLTIEQLQAVKLKLSELLRERRGKRR